MTKSEEAKLAVVASDIKWLIDANKEVLVRLAKLNGQVEKNTVSSQRNRSHINIQWWIITAVIIATALKAIGVY
uniref:Uncharacterized protein n=1 Tax=viral metagenome TaxID=1070528 RepID=A0A6M3LAT5_9ZZZZ